MPFESLASSLAAARQGARQALELICKCEHPKSRGEGTQPGNCLQTEAQGGCGMVKSTARPASVLTGRKDQGQQFLLPCAGSRRPTKWLLVANTSQINVSCSEAEWLDWMLSLAVSPEA